MGTYAQVVDANAIGIRLVVQSHRQRGLCTVFSDLLDFDGNELYMHCEPSLVGETFGQSLVAYEVCSPIGLRSAGGQVRLNPPMHTVIGVGDEVVMLAEDDVLIQLTHSGGTRLRERHNGSGCRAVPGHGHFAARLEPPGRRDRADAGQLCRARIPSRGRQPTQGPNITFADRHAE